MKDPKNLLILALAVAAAFFAGGAFRPTPAMGQGYPGGTSDSNNRMVAVTGTIGSGVSVLWVIDTIDRRLAVYRCNGGKSIELVAARNIEWDFKINQFRDDSLHGPDVLRKLHLRGAGVDEASPGGSAIEPKEPGVSETPERPGVREDD